MKYPTREKRDVLENGKDDNDKKLGLENGQGLYCVGPRRSQ